tara:strand:- start:2114 stop:2713 length:600 start_codon:yes stop_codon:yes gene_type:complete
MNNKRISYSRLLPLMFVLSLLVGAPPTLAHHVLGRPAYSLSEDSNTPPSAVVETQIGDYTVIYMVFPAFPQPNEPGRVNLYASHIESGEAFDGEVTFIAKNDSWFNQHETVLGTQTIDDGVYRQGFVFDATGDYIISATFVAQGHDYAIDFPLRIGAPPSIGPLGVLVVLLGGALLGASLWRRKRPIRDKVRTASRKLS